MIFHWLTEDTSENENENIYTEASSDNYHQTQKAMQSLKSTGVRRCQSRSTVNWIKLSSRRTDQTTENNSQEMAACLFSRKRTSRGHEQELREELLQSPRIGIENYFIWQSFIATFPDLTNGFSHLMLNLGSLFCRYSPVTPSHRHNNINVTWLDPVTRWATLGNPGVVHREGEN